MVAWGLGAAAWCIAFVAALFGAIYADETTIPGNSFYKGNR